MKKFITLSLLVAIAGIAVGIIRRQDSGTPLASAEVVAAAQQDTGNILEPYQKADELAASSITTAPKKVAAKVTTTTAKKAGTPVAAMAPTTSTTRPVATTTTTTVAPVTTTSTVPAAPAPTCSTTADQPKVGPHDTQTIQVTSNQPNSTTVIEMSYPKFDLKVGVGNPRQTYSTTTDAAGSASKSFMPSDWSTAPTSVLVRIYNSSSKVVATCQTTFQSVA